MPSTYRPGSRHVKGHAPVVAGLACAAAALLLAGPSTTSAAITLEWDFDHGALDEATTTITDTVVTLGPRDDIYYSRWIYVKATDVLGLNPEFRISDAYPAGSTLSNYHRYVYSYDQQTWQFFDNGVNTGGYYRFSNNAPFTQNVVWLAYGLPYPLAATIEHTNQVAASPWVSPTPSADASFVIGLSNDGTLTDKGRPVPQHEIYGYKISDPSATGSKQVVVLTTGNHPNETTGTYTFQGMVDFILSDDPRAAALRQAADFYVYPTSNPDGRWAGHSRSNPENPWADHNRYWNDPVGFTDITVVTTAMKADTNSAADWFFDFHSYNDATSFACWMYPEHVTSAFAQGLVAREPGIVIMTATVEDDGPGVARHWAHLPEGLNAEYTFTPEAGFIPGWGPGRWFEIGQNYALALYDAIVSDDCPDVTSSGIAVFEDDFDAGTSGLTWDLYTSSSDYTADFAFDYSTEGIPPAPNAVAGTTIGAKFTVNNNDAIAQTAAVSAFPAGQYFDGNYALKFDVWINYPSGTGAAGTTEFMTAGINHSGTQVCWPENPSADGYYFAVTGEGGALQDYRAYDGATMLPVSSGVYVSGGQNQSDSFYQSLFPSPPFPIAGTPGKQWVAVEIRQVDGEIEWRLNNTPVAIITAPSVVAGNVMIGYMDVFSSIASPAADAFIVFDNVRVEALLNPDCNGNGVPDACEAVGGGDFDADGDVDVEDLAAFAECLAGPDLTPAPADQTCGHLCFDAFDFDGDEDVDLADFAEFQVAFMAP